MRRVLLAALAAPLLAAPAASANHPCDPEEGCHPHDCIAWDPVNEAPWAVEEAKGGYVAEAVQRLLPPPCP